jgi:hypothetical protein
VGRAASPTAGVLDSQSAKAAEAGGPRGYDAGKNVSGASPADVQSRDGLLPLLRSSRRSFPFFERIL